VLAVAGGVLLGILAALDAQRRLGCRRRFLAGWVAPDGTGGRLFRRPGGRPGALLLAFTATICALGGCGTRSYSERSLPIDTMGGAGNLMMGNYQHTPAVTAPGDAISLTRPRRNGFYQLQQKVRPSAT